MDQEDYGDEYESRFLISTDLFKENKNWLKENLYFSPDLLNVELRIVTALLFEDAEECGNQKCIAAGNYYYCVNKEIEEAIVKRPLPVIPESEPLTFEAILDSAQNLLFYTHVYNIDELKELWDETTTSWKKYKVNTPDRFSDDKVLSILKLLTVFKDKDSTAQFHQYFIDPQNVDYTYHIRPDMLKLYRFFHDDFSNVQYNNNNNESTPVYIEYKDKKIELKNVNSWFIYMMKRYLDKYLGVNNILEAKYELNNDYRTKCKKSGRQVPYYYPFLMCTYALLCQASYQFNAKKVAMEHVRFIMKFFDYLGITKSLRYSPGKNPEKNIKAKIEYYLENPQPIKWFKDPEYKYSPNNVNSALAVNFHLW